MEFQAAIHGVKSKDKAPKNNSPAETSGKFAGCVPGDPDTYAHLTKEQREEWTQKLIHRHKNIIGK